jgi:hypothetical protein
MELSLSCSTIFSGAVSLVPRGSGSNDGKYTRFFTTSPVNCFCCEHKQTEAAQPCIRRIKEDVGETVGEGDSPCAGCGVACGVQRTSSQPSLRWES